MRPMTARTKEGFVRDFHDEAGEMGAEVKWRLGTTTDEECEIPLG